ncbi:hypothetical protein D7V77_04860 [Corallococcus sp. CA041A]|nr:hypothetical protein D7V77_04860 [Corallococcus sp. CA041A]
MTRLGNGRSVEILLVMDDRELLAALRTRLRQTSSEQSPVWGVLKGLRSHVARCLQEGGPLRGSSHDQQPNTIERVREHGLSLESLESALAAGGLKTSPGASTSRAGWLWSAWRPLWGGQLHALTRSRTARALQGR